MIIVLPDEIHFALLKHMNTPKEWQNYSEAFLHLTTDDYFWKKLIDRFPKLTRDRCQTMNWDAALTNAKFKPVNVNYCGKRFVQTVNAARKLLDQGVDPNVPLYYVQNVEIARLLLDYGADLHHKNHRGETPLHRVQNADVARVLLEHTDPEHKANLKDKWDNTPLHLTKEEDIVRVFLDFGADPNLKNDLGQTPLHYSGDSFGKAKLLLERGADPNVKDKYGNSSLHYAKTADIVNLFLDRRADPNKKNNDGETPLHKHFVDTELEVFRVLLERGADPNIKNNDGETPLHFAATVEIAEMLLEHGADPNARPNARPNALQNNLKKLRDVAVVDFLIRWVTGHNGDEIVAVDFLKKRFNLLLKRVRDIHEELNNSLILLEREADLNLSAETVEIAEMLLKHERSDPNARYAGKVDDVFKRWVEKRFNLLTKRVDDINEELENFIFLAHETDFFTITIE